MGYPKFNIALMMTPDDGNLHPTLFPARSQIIDFCHDFRLKRYIGSINEAVARIKEKIEAGYTTAIYWHSLMFVKISKSEDAINRVIKANEKYSGDKPVTVIV